MDISIQKINEVYCRIVGTYEAIEQLAEHFTFEVPGYKFNPKFQSGMWDGQIRLLNKATGALYLGLASKAIDLCHDLGLEVNIDPQLIPDTKDYRIDVAEFVETLGLPFEPYDYQLESVAVALRDKRKLIISPTSSGKSLMIYILTQILGLKTLIISPRKGLVKQLVADLKEYGYTQEVHTIMAGSDKNSPELLTISTWQSVYKEPPRYFDQYDVIIGDEVHLFESKCIGSMMEKTRNTEYKIGFTGSLKGTQTHELVLTGLFGSVHETVTIRELIDRGIVSQPEIIVIVFVHSDETQAQLPSRHEFSQEDTLIVKHPKRNKYISKLVSTLKGNTLVVFRKITNQGDLLNKLLVDSGRKVHYIHGKIDADVREEIRLHMEQADDEVLLASSGTSSTGISIKNIQNMVQANSIKSRIDLLQTFGRGLRRDGKSNTVRFFDLADKFVRTGVKNQAEGYSYRHLLERLEIYNEQQLPYKLIEVPL